MLIEKNAPPNLLNSSFKSLYFQPMRLHAAHRSLWKGEMGRGGRRELWNKILLKALVLNLTAVLDSQLTLLSPAP